MTTHNIFSRKIIQIISKKIFGVLLVATMLFSFAPAPVFAYYAPGETMNPLCAPGASGCDISPTTAVSSGGTGLTSFTAGDLLYASATTTLVKLAIGADGKVLKVSGGALSWEDDAGAGGGISSLNGLSISSQTFATSTTGSDFNIVSSGSMHTFNIPSAASTARGLLTATDWTTFNAKENVITASTTATYFRGDKTWQALNTTNVVEGTNLYYTDARSRNALSSSALGLTYATSTGTFSLTSGYNIPLTASTTNWNGFYDTPSNRITAGTGLAWTANTLAVVGNLATTTINGASGPNFTFNAGAGLAISTSTNALTFTPSYASATTDGIISTSTQTFAGAKTFSSTPTFSSMTAGSVYFAGAGGALTQDNSNLFWDNTNKRLGIGTAAPTDALHIYGGLKTESTVGTIMTAANNGEFTYNFGSGTSNSLSVRVSQSVDDAEESLTTNSVSLTSSDLELINDSGVNQEVGIRFQNITIPQGATITNAYVEFTTDAVTTGATSLNFYGQNADNAAVFAVATNNITSRAKTSATVAWNNVPAWSTIGATNQTPNLTSIVQEIVNRPGWLSGNALAIIVTGTAGGLRTAVSYNGNPATAPLLVIQYTTSNTNVSYVINNLGPGMFKINDESNDTSPFVIDSSGNVGIGTSTPSAALHITPSAAVALRLDAFGASAGNTAELRFQELAANGANYAGFKSPDALGANALWTLPNADGLSGQVLSTDGGGVLSWVTKSTTTINGASGPDFTFNAGTSGTDFTIATTTNTLSFNLPTASSTVRGLLSSTDWSTFNNKENAITASTTNTYYRGDKTFQTLDTLAVPENTNLYYTDARSRNALSSSALGLTYATSTGTFSLTSGYNIPLSASTTNWNGFYDTPSNRITAGTGLAWTANTLAVVGNLATTTINGASGPDFTFNAGAGLTISTSTNALTFTPSYASATIDGIISTSTQTFAGAKTFSSTPTFSSMTAGSVYFAGAGGLVSQDNAGLFWDDVNDRLGIGTPTPDADSVLHVRKESANTSLYVTTDSTSTIASVWLINDFLGSKSNGYQGIASFGSKLRLVSNVGGTFVGSDGITVASGGNVGIGTAAPERLLHVARSATDGVNGDVLNSYEIAQFKVHGSDGGKRGLEIGAPTAIVVSPVYLKVHGTGNRLAFLDQNNVETVTILEGGSVGIGDTSPDALLDVKGTVCLDLNADEACTDNTAAISDGRLKDNVQNITGALEKIGKLRGVTFSWNGLNNTGNGTSLGFIAQEVEQIFPEIVITDTAGYKNLSYDKLTAVLTAGMQEQQGIITTIQSDIETLKQSIATGLGSGLGSVNIETLDKLAISGALSVDGEVDLGKDSVGEAVVRAGSTEVAVVFEKSYQYQPVVTVSKLTQGILSDYFVDEISKSGFKIKIEPAQNKDIKFSWHAFGSKNGVRIFSDGLKEDIGVVVPVTASVETESVSEGPPESVVDDIESVVATSSDLTTTSTSESMNSSEIEQSINTPLEPEMETESESADKIISTPEPEPTPAPVVELPILVESVTQTVE